MTYEYINSFNSTITEKEGFDKFYSESAEKFHKDALGDQANQGYLIVAKAMDLFSFRQKQCRILDVAAGTGLVGGKLRKLGYVSIDALEPQESMINIARQQGIYDNYLIKFIEADKLEPIKDQGMKHRKQVYSKLNPPILHKLGTYTPQVSEKPDSPISKLKARKPDHECLNRLCTNLKVSECQLGDDFCSSKCAVEFAIEDFWDWRDEQKYQEKEEQRLKTSLQRTLLFGEDISDEDLEETSLNKETNIKSNNSNGNVVENRLEFLRGRVYSDSSNSTSPDNSVSELINDTEMLDPSTLDSYSPKKDNNRFNGNLFDRIQNLSPGNGCKKIDSPKSLSDVSISLNNRNLFKHFGNNEQHSGSGNSDSDCILIGEVVPAKRRKIYRKIKSPIVQEDSDSDVQILD